nr:acyl-CoA--sterol O-acyltransferase 1-like [Ipomoea batatas]
MEGDMKHWMEGEITVFIKDMALHIPLSLLLLLCCENGSHWPSQAAAFPPCNLSLSPHSSRPPLRPFLRHHRILQDRVQKHQTPILSPNELFREKLPVEVSANRQKSAVSYAVKAVLMDIILALVAALARAVLGLELEPTFNEPYLSPSLQDFWGSRWNLMVNRILRPAVYSPFLDVSDKYLGRKWATYPAVIATFMVSGLMHELIYFYLSRVRPTWEVTWFFFLHGACVAVEIAVKKALRGRCRLPGILGTILTLGFFTLTVCWLFLPQLLRCDVLVKVLAEYAALGSFVKDVAIALTLGARSS